MRYEEIRGQMLPKVGLGTWSIGGGSQADRRKDAVSLAALRSALELGYKHFDTAESYAAGHCEELIGIALRDSGVDRAGLFITSKVKPEHLSADQVAKACEGSLKRLGTEYLDLYLIHWPNHAVPLVDTLKALNQLQRSGKVRHLGVSNFDLRLLKESERLAETPLLTNQVPYSVNDRSYAENGVVDYCQQHGILITAYSPLDQRSFRAGKGVARVAKARGLTERQIALAWLCKQPCVITIPMSADAAHQRENLAAADVVLSDQEMQLIG